MKLTDLTKPKYLKEAPLGDYELVGKWGDQEKAHSFHDPKDRRAVQNPKVKAKLEQKLGNTEHTFNMFFVNLPGMRKHGETGVRDVNWVRENIPAVSERIEEKNIDIENNVNVIFVSNFGTDKVPMTPWIMAHRIGHALQSSSSFSAVGRQETWWTKAEKEFAQYMEELLIDVYGVRNMPETDILYNSPLMARFYQEIGTMRSAREKKLGDRPYEFFYELFAQYITTGSIKFRPAPMVVKHKTKGMLRSNLDQEDLTEYTDGMLNMGLNLQLEPMFDNALEEVKGQFLIM